MKILYLMVRGHGVRCFHEVGLLKVRWPCRRSRRIRVSCVSQSRAVLRGLTACAALQT